jgi:hypothetical protein
MQCVANYQKIITFDLFCVGACPGETKKRHIFAGEKDGCR